jgi:hypothetical protein
MAWCISFFSQGHYAEKFPADFADWIVSADALSSLHRFKQNWLQVLSFTKLTQIDRR